MEPSPNTAPASRAVDPSPSHSRSTSSRIKSNTYRYREEWLQAAVNLIAPMFAKVDAPIPDLGRAAIGFPSKGAKGNCVGECWHSTASADQHFEIFIRPDKSDPVEVLGILTHELVHAAVPLGSGHGPIYKALALKIGLIGKMRHAMPGIHLTEVLKGFSTELGPFPHASLNIEYRESAPRKKQKTNLLKAFCEGVKDDSGKVMEACDYVCRITSIHAKKGAPICGVHSLRMQVEWPAEDDAGEGESEESDGQDGFKSSVPPVSEAAPVAQPTSVVAASGFRPVLPNEVLPPGHTIRLNMTTGAQEVSEVAPWITHQS